MANSRCPENYLAAFKQAELTFLHQRVFCPQKKEIVLLAELGPGLDLAEMPYIGADVAKELAQAVAVGDVNPISKQPIVLESLPAGRRNSTRNATAPVPSQSIPAGKSIDSYFKGARRIPMGEMDPNCFAVEPRQVAALTQNGLVPRTFPLPRPYLNGDNGVARSDRPRPYVSASRPLRRRTEPIGNMLDFDVLASGTANRRRTADPGYARQCPRVYAGTTTQETTIV